MTRYEVDNFGIREAGTLLGNMQLTDGRDVGIRLASADELPDIGVLLDGLGSEAKRRRFCGNPGNISKLWDEHIRLIEAGEIEELDLVAVSDEGIIGHTMVVGRGVVNVACAVRDNDAGQGVGRALTATGFELIKQRGDWAVKTDVMVENRTMLHVLDEVAAATGVYETNAFTSYGVTERCDRFVGSTAIPCSDCEFSRQLGGCEISNNRRR